jgi:hypothetical protein
MLRAVLPMVTVLGLALLPHPGQAASITTLKSLKLDVPSDTMFPAGRMRSTTTALPATRPTTC